MTDPFRLNIARRDSNDCNTFLVRRVSILKTAFDSHKLFVRVLAAVTENSLLRASLKSGTDAFASERERLERR